MPPENTQRALMLLTNTLRPPSENSLVIQRPMVLQEIQRAYDTPLIALYKYVIANLFANHAIGRDVLGTVDYLRTLPYKQLVSFWRRRYQPPNITLAVVGDLDSQSAGAMAESCHWPAPYSGSKEREARPQARSTTAWICHPWLTQQYLGIGISGPGLEIGLEIYPFLIFSKILVGRLNAHLRKLGEIAQVNAFYVSFDDCGFMFIMLVLLPSSAQTGVQVLNAVLEKLSNVDIPEDEWRVAKTQFALGLAQENENYANAASNLIRRWQTMLQPMTATEELAHVLNITANKSSVCRNLLRAPRCAVALGSRAQDSFPELASLISG